MISVVQYQAIRDVLGEARIDAKLSELEGMYSAVQDGLHLKVRACSGCGWELNGLWFISCFKRKKGKCYWLRSRCRYCEALRISLYRRSPVARLSGIDRDIYIIRLAHRLGCSPKAAKRKVMRDSVDTDKARRQRLKGGIRRFIVEVEQRQR